MDSPQASAAVPRLPLSDVLAGISHTDRWRILREISKRGMQVIELGEVLRIDPNLISKHMRVLLDYELVAVSRARVYSIPPGYLSGPGLVDYGHCLLRLDD